MNLNTNNSLLQRIHDEIWTNQDGIGFTVEIWPTITQYKEYVPREIYFGLDKLKYKRKTLDISSVSPRDIIGFEKIADVSWGYPARTMPNGIYYQYSEIEVYRDDFKGIGTPETAYANENKKYIEGKRTYLTVTDAYASKFLKENNSEMVFSFRDVLLTQHSEILYKMANFLCYGSFGVTTHGITRVGYSFCSDDLPDDYLTFDKLGMLPLKSTEQLCGMALAIVATLKKIQPTMSNSILCMREWRYGVSVTLVEKPEEPPKNELKSW